MTDAVHRHVPVLLDRVLDLLSVPVEAVADPVVVDTTLGLGGHTAAMLERFEKLRVVAIDRDASAIAIARTRLADFGDRVTFVHAAYDHLPAAIEGAGFPHVDGVLFDLGVSSMQLDEAGRGFAYAKDAPLDMRMNAEDPVTAADVLNSYDVRDLARVLQTYGEERFARRIAERIVTERARAPFDTSGRLVELLYDVIPAPARRTGGHPAKRTFQALRIEVNDEIGTYERALPASLDALRPGGRVVVLAYHSLEDRITKKVFAAATTDAVPDGLPVVPHDRAAAFSLVTRGAEQATDDEISTNPRAKSVRLRCIERIAA